MTITTQTIGTVSLGIDGSDMYLIVTSTTDTLTKREAEDWLASAYLRDTDRPGGVFCHNVYVTPHPAMSNAFIGLVQIRYDV